MKTKRGQTAIEFLTTYSWALLIIIMAVGALMYFDVFNTTRYLSETCDTGAQISCVEAAATEGGDLRLRLVNNHPRNITITRIDTELGTITGSSEPNKLLERGETDVFITNTNAPLSSNSRETFNVEIYFRRPEGGHEYFVRGRVVVRPLPAGVI